MRRATDFRARGASNNENSPYKTGEDRAKSVDWGTIASPSYMQTLRDNYPDVFDNEDKLAKPHSRIARGGQRAFKAIRRRIGVFEKR
jgi:hypothetical protein